MKLITVSRFIRENKNRIFRTDAGKMLYIEDITSTYGYLTDFNGDIQLILGTGCDSMPVRLYQDGDTFVVQHIHTCRSTRLYSRVPSADVSRLSCPMTAEHAWRFAA